MNSQILKRKKQQEAIKSLENSLRGTVSEQVAIRVVDSGPTRAQTQSLPEHGSIRTKFKHQRSARKVNEADQYTIAQSVSESGDPGKGQGLGTDFITHEPLSCAHVPSSRARGAASVSNSSSISPVVNRWKEETLENLRLSEKSFKPSRYDGQTDGSAIKKSEPRSTHKNDNETYNTIPTPNITSENSTLAKTVKRHIQNQKKFNYNSKLCDVSIFGTKSHVKSYADTSSSSPDYQNQFPLPRSPKAAQAAPTRVKDKPSSSCQDLTGTDSTEKSDVDYARSLRIVNAKKIFEPSEAKPSVDHDNQDKIRLKPKMSAAIQSIQERLVKEMEEDPSRVRKSYDSTKVHKVQASRPKCTWTPGMLAGVARKRSRSRYSGIARRASRYISPNKRERPYRQWLGMSTCVTTDTKFIIASAQPTSDSVVNETSGAQSTRCATTQNSGGRGVRSRDVSNHKMMVGRECKIRRRSSVRQSPDSHISLQSKDVGGFTDGTKIVRPDNTLGGKFHLIQRSEKRVKEIHEESLDSISMESDPTLQEVSDFELNSMDIHNVDSAESTLIKNKEPNTTLDFDEDLGLVADYAEMSSANMPKRESTKNATGVSDSGEGVSNTSSPDSRREAVGKFKVEINFSENLTEDTMDSAIKVIAKSKIVDDGENLDYTLVDSSTEKNYVRMKGQETHGLEKENMTTPTENLADRELTEPLCQNLTTESNELTLEASSGEKDFNCLSFPIENEVSSKVLEKSQYQENIRQGLPTLPSTREYSIPNSPVSESRNENEIINEKEKVNQPLGVNSNPGSICKVPSNVCSNFTLSPNNSRNLKFAQQEIQIRLDSVDPQPAMHATNEIQNDTVIVRKRCHGNGGERHYSVKQKETESALQQPYAKTSPKFFMFLADKAHEDSFISAKIADSPVFGDSVCPPSARDRCPATQSVGGRRKSKFLGEEISVMPNTTGKINSFLNSPRAFTSARPKHFFRVNDNKTQSFPDREEENNQSKTGGSDRSRVDDIKGKDPQSPQIAVDPDKNDSSKHTKNSKYKYVQAIVDFQGILPGQLSFTKGQIIRQRCVNDVCGMRYGSYRVGRLKKKRKGLYPASCVTDYLPPNQSLI